MGVIQRFAVSSMVLGVLAMAGGASAIAFDGSGGGASPAVQPSDSSVSPSDVRSDVPADEVIEVLPETGGPDAAARWLTTRPGPAGR